MYKILSVFSVLAISEIAIHSVIAGRPHQKREPQNKLESHETIHYLQTSNLEYMKRTKRHIINLPQDAHMIAIHNMRHFNVYGSSNGAYKVVQGSNYAEKLVGIDGKVISAIITDNNYKQIYNIYFTVKPDNCIFEYYALKDGETTVKKINGLPNDAKLLTIHNLAGVIFFGSSSGAYELMQGQLTASKINHANGYVVHIKLGGSPNKYDAEFISVDNVVDECKYRTELKQLDFYKNKISMCQVQIEEYKNEVKRLNKIIENCNEAETFEPITEDTIKIVAPKRKLRIGSIAAN